MTREAPLADIAEPLGEARGDGSTPWVSFGGLFYHVDTGAGGLHFEILPPA